MLTRSLYPNLLRMSRNKKAVTRRKRSPSRRPSGRARNTSRFFKAFSSSAVLAFSVASWFLYPDWQTTVSPTSLLSEWAAFHQAPTAALVPPSGDIAQTNFAQCRQFFPGQQPPAVPARPALRELCFDSFAILHDGGTKTPVFAVQRLTRTMLDQARAIERTDRFYAEARLPKHERAELTDYRSSGFSRGHMAPAGDMHTPEAMAQSFSLANMVPQDQTQNAGAWSRIEQDTRKYVMRTRGPVYIFTGPVYGPEPRRVGAGGVAVPDYLFKLVHDAGTGRSWVHWQANHADAVAGRPISYDQFVEWTGLHLLPSSG